MKSAMCFVIYGRKIVALKKKNHIEFPIFELKEDQSPQEVLQKELPEYIGAVVTKPVLITELKIDWYQESDAKKKD